MIAGTISAFLLPQTDTDLVSYKVAVNGVPVREAYHVVSMSVQEGVNKLPMAQLVLLDGSASEENFEISDQGDFAPGNKIEISLGYHGNNDLVFRGIIITNSHKINSHCCEMTIDCKDERTKMSITSTGKHYGEATDDDIIDELITNNAMPAAERKNNSQEAAGDDKKGTVHESLVQSNVTDWDFMISRIDANASICLIHNGELHIRKPDLAAAPALYLSHGKDILELQADMDSRNQASAVETSAWDYKEQKVVTIKGEYPQGTDAEKDPSGGESADSGETIKSFLGKISAVMDKPLRMTASYMTEEELQAIADSKLQKQALTPVKGRVKYQGSPMALPGDFINISGAGNQLNGKHFVSAVRHDYADGCWTTEATLGWDDKFYAENIQPNQASSATGQLSTIQGLHIAIVTEIEDAAGQYRVKVRLPLINENDDGIYARVATLDAGNNRGTFFRPETGDEVLVGFMNNDPRHPVILGMLHSSAKPAPLEPAAANHEKGYVSRSGIRMIFNDEKKSMRIETPGNRVIEIDDNAGSIRIEDPNGNKITMDSNGITIEAAMDLKLKAGKSISVEAPQVSIKADAAMSVQGGKTDITSSGPTTIKGAMVMIN